MSDSVSITLPAICNGTTEAFPHLTLLYSGLVKEQNFPLDFVLNEARLKDLRYDKDRKFTATVTQLSHFGTDESILVAEVKLPDSLRVTRNEWLYSGLLEHRSEFDFKPHITLGSISYTEAVRPGDEVTLLSPILWWGDYKIKL